MNVPNFTNIQFVDKDGKLTPTAFFILEQLFSQAQQNLSNNGFQIPNQPTSFISSLASPQNGLFIYDSTANAFKGCANGTIKTFTVT